MIVLKVKTPQGILYVGCESEDKVAETMNIYRAVGWNCTYKGVPLNWGKVDGVRVKAK